MEGTDLELKIMGSIFYWQNIHNKLDKKGKR